MTDEDYEKRADEIIKELGPLIDRERLLTWLKSHDMHNKPPEKGTTDHGAHVMSGQKRPPKDKFVWLMAAYIVATGLLVFGLATIIGHAIHSADFSGGLRPIIAEIWCGSRICLDEKP